MWQLIQCMHSMETWTKCQWWLMKQVRHPGYYTSLMLHERHDIVLYGLQTSSPLGWCTSYHAILCSKGRWAVHILSPLQQYPIMQQLLLSVKITGEKVVINIVQEFYWYIRQLTSVWRCVCLNIIMPEALALNKFILSIAHAHAHTRARAHTHTHTHTQGC